MLYFMKSPELPVETFKTNLRERHRKHHKTFPAFQTIQQLFQAAITGDSVAYNQPMIDDARQKFGDNYKDKNGNAAWATDISILWTDFNKRVTDIITGIGGDPNGFALKFIHRYNATGAQGFWFLTVEIFKIVAEEAPEKTCFDYEIESANKFFDITPAGLVNADSSSLTSTLDYGFRDDIYFEHVTQKDGTALDVTKHVNSIIFSWVELQSLYYGNKIGRNDDSKFDIIFTSIAPGFDTTQHPPHALVSNPHSMLIYMKYDGHDCLFDHDVIAGNFYNMAADYNTLCPPYHNTCLWAKTLPKMLVLPVHP
ncbi:hypothetical protein ACTHGU_11400 [Chitinophagaceae bacterium MMS25-I14]